MGADGEHLPRAPARARGEAPAGAGADDKQEVAALRKQLADARKQLEATEWDLRAADRYRRAYETGQWDDGSPATARAEGAEMMRFVAGGAPAANRGRGRRPAVAAARLYTDTHARTEMSADRMRFAQEKRAHGASNKRIMIKPSGNPFPHVPVPFRKNSHPTP